MSVPDPRNDRPDPMPTGQRSVRPMPSYDHLEGDEISLLRILNVLLRRWRVVVFVPLVAAGLTALASLITPPTFTATSAFVPEVRPSARLAGGIADLAGLASQFGVSLGSDGSQSPRFYAQVARSRDILERLLLSRFPLSAASGSTLDSITLLQSLGIRGRSLPDSLERGITRFRERLTVKVDNPTNIVTLSVEAKDPDLAANAANRLVTYLNDFNAQVRQSQARQKRKFVEQRVGEGERDLKDAEEQLRRFYESNRSWQQAPQLVFREGRLRRQVEIRENLYMTLRREFETARIEEVNDIPVITVIDLAVPPQRRSWPKRALLVILALVLGSLVAIVWAFATDYLERARMTGAQDYVEFRDLLTRARLGMSHLMRRPTTRDQT